MDAVAVIADMVREAEKHADGTSADRVRAVEYYQGTMKDTPHEEGRSGIVSRDVRAHVKKVLPSLVRTILGSSQVVEYQPAQEGDEQAAEQATDYVNMVVAKDCNLRRQVEDALHDALLLRNGILKWYWDEKQTVRITKHTGLSEDALAMLGQDDNVEVIEASEYVEEIEGQPIPLYDVKLRRTETNGSLKVCVVPRDRFLIHPDAVTLEDSILVGDKTPVTRSELVEMGYDKDKIDKLPLADDDDYEHDIRRDFVEGAHENHGPNETIDYYNLYVRYDEDGDGIAELRNMVFAGKIAENCLLMDEECDEIQYADVRIMTQPHQWEGLSLADDLSDIQRVKTVLVRQTLDNLYWQNNPQPVFQEGGVKNKDSVFNPEFGKPIEVTQGFDANTAVSFMQVPFVAQQSFSMLEYMDAEAQDRTGISDASAGLAPDALQNMTATGAEMLNQAGIGQVELMVQTAADGLRRLFRGILRTIIRHQDRPRTVRLRGEWVEFDPRHWNSEMDCDVNVGLGAGTRERDMQMMQVVMGLQEKLLTAFGPNNPFVKPENLWEALSKTVESAGLKTPEMYFTQPDPQEIQQLMESQSNPEAEKAQQEAALEQQKAQHDAQLKRQEVEAEIQRKREQMQAEFQLKREQMQAEMQLRREQMEYEARMRAEFSQSSGMSAVRMGGAVG